MKRTRQRIAIPLALLLLGLPVVAGAVFMEVGTVQTSGTEPLIEKTGTLSIHNGQGVAIENIVATLQESAEGLFTIVDGTVELSSLAPDATVETTDTFTVEVDTSAEYSPNIPMEWLVDFDLGGQPQQITLHAVLEVPEMDDE